MAVSGKRQVAALVGDVKRSLQDVAADSDMSRPRYDVCPEVFVSPGLKAIQVVRFDQTAA